jgi:tetraacyldisaccharide 4'-kinase
MLAIKKWYINFLEKEKYNFAEIVLYFVLYILSFIYGSVVYFRNLCYDFGAPSAYKSEKKVIGIGNISWAGSGKTTLAMYLYNKLISKYKVAVLRRGYGKDEGLLLKECGIKVFSDPDRVHLAKELSGQFDIFILDDAFQYRRFKRDLNIVVMAAREFKKNIRLLPASFFREPISSLTRADILILNYTQDLQNYKSILQDIQSKFAQLKIYTANYKVSKITRLDGEVVGSDLLRAKPLAAVTAIGYPEGFFNKLRETGLNIAKKIVFPDHYDLKPKELSALQESLKKEGISDMIITPKDKYHLPRQNLTLNTYILQIEIDIDEEAKFLTDIANALQ